MKKYISIFSTIFLLSCSHEQNTTNDAITPVRDSVQQQNHDSTTTKLDSTSQQRRFLLQEIDKTHLLIANGTEPGWAFSLFEDKFIFVGNYGQDTIIETHNINTQRLPIYYKSPSISFTIDKSKCIAISGEEMNISVKIIYKGKELQGCGKLLR